MKLFNKIISFSIIVLLAVFFVSCGDPGDSTGDNQGGYQSFNPGTGMTPPGSNNPGYGTGEGQGTGQGSGSSNYTANTPSRDITLNTYDAIPEFSTVVYVNLTDRKVGLDEDSVNTSIPDSDELKLDNGVSFKYKDGLLKINSTSYTSNICYKLYGTITDYGVQIKTNDNTKTKVILSGASIKSKETPCLSIKTDESEDNLFYVVLEGSNTLEDGRKYGTLYSEDNKGTLFSDGALIFSGDGSLTIEEGYKHGVASKDYIKINSGTITVNSTGRNGFHATNGFIMNAGTVTVKGTGKNTNNESRGIVVEGSEDNPGEGFIVINGGTLDITTVSKGITAKWDIEDDAETTATTDDPYPYVKITGGTVNVKTTGTPTKKDSTTTATITDADGVTTTEVVKLAPEGIEGKQSLFITGGEITINSTDDCINSSASSAVIEISGGSIYAVSSNNDAIDSNGTLTISGGTVVGIATHNAECAFDCDHRTFSITGGTVAGIGSSNYTVPTASACKQGVLVLGSSYLGSAKKTIAVKNSSGSVVYAFTIPSGTSLNGCVGVFSSSALKNTGSYTLVYGSTASGGEESNGLYTDTTAMPTVSGGSSESNISFSSYVYTLGASSGGGMDGGVGGGGGRR